MFSSLRPRIDDGIIGERPPGLLLSPLGSGEESPGGQEEPGGPPRPVIGRTRLWSVRSHVPTSTWQSRVRNAYGHDGDVSKAAFSSDIRQLTRSFKKYSTAYLQAWEAGGDGMCAETSRSDRNFLPTPTETDGAHPSFTPQGVSFLPSPRPEVTLGLGHLFEGS